MLMRMIQIAQMLGFLCILIGWSMAFPHYDVNSEDKVMKDVEWVARVRRDAEMTETDFTPPACRVVNASLDCPYSCGNATWEVTYIITDRNASGIANRYATFYDPGKRNFTISHYSEETVDENGFSAIVVKYLGSCCFKDVRIKVVDNAGNQAECPLDIKLPIKTSSSSSTTVISLWSGLLAMTLKSMLL